MLFSFVNRKVVLIQVINEQVYNKLTSFVFTLTEKDSNRQRFGICVNFYRHFSRRTCTINNHNQQKTIELIHLMMVLVQLIIHQIKHQQLGGNGDGSDSIERKRKRRLRNNTLTSICLISHHPFFTRFRECLITLKTIIDACDERSCAKRTGASRGTSRFDFKFLSIFPIDLFHSFSEKLFGVY